MTRNAIARHTPGPWSYDFAPSTGNVAEFMVMGPNIAVVAHIWPDKERGVSGGIVEANARLIAAAPELLDALKEVVRAFMPMHPPEFVTAAIAKAEGREP